MFRSAQGRRRHAKRAFGSNEGTGRGRTKGSVWSGERDGAPARQQDIANDDDDDDTPAAGPSSTGPTTNSTLVNAVAAVVAACVFAAYVRAAFAPRFDVPGHLLHGATVISTGMISPARGRALRDLVLAEGVVQAGGAGGFSTNVYDTDFYQPHHEHVGEAVAPDAAGRCAHPFLVPSRDASLCILPGRVDVGRHYIMYGGVAALRESYEALISRVQSFGRYYFDNVRGITIPPAMQDLFKSAKFVEAATAVCPPGKQHLDPFQFNFIVQVPGQTVPTHIDGAYFWGASRFQFPQWLLAAMVFSGKFEERFVDQVQVVGYLHQWEATEARGGNFVVWSDGPNQGGAPPPPGGADVSVPRVVAPEPLAGTSVDGSKTVHAAKVYYPSRLPPFLDKSRRSTLAHDGGGRWTLSTAGDAAPLRNYTTDDLRITVVYRSRCFASAARAREFRAQLKGDAGEGGRLSLDAVLSTLAEGLPAGGAYKRNGTAADRLALAMAIIDRYVKYPLPDEGAAPLAATNYCALPRLVPWTKALLQPLCG